MDRLSPAEGEGRLLRTEQLLAFAIRPDPSLFAAIDGSVDGFKRVAEYVVTNSFDVPPFVVLNTTSGAVLLFGELVVESSDGTTITAANTSTWVEGDLDLGGAVRCLPAGMTPPADVSLESGCIAAGGFVFGEEAPIAPTPVETVRHVEALDEAESVGAVERLAPVQLDDVDAGDYDPLRDPEHVDLERLGARVALPDEDSSPFVMPSTEATPPAEGSQKPATLEAPEKEGHRPPGSSGPETLIPPTADVPHGIPPPPSPDRGWAPPSAPADEVGRPVPPPPPTREQTQPPPTPSFPLPPSQQQEPQAPEQSPALEQSPAPDPRQRFTLRFDDGQVVEVQEGVYVGRRPDKRGLPDNFQAITVRGEHVSRVHWALSVTDGTAVLRDLGSQSGTTVQIDDHPPVPVTAEGVGVAPNTVIHFADRWAALEAGGEPSGG